MLLQELIIGLLVALAAVYVLWSFMPLQRRQWLLDLLAARGLAVRAAAAHRKRLATPGCSHCGAAEGQLKAPRR